MALKENYKDDILDVSVNTKRKYRMTENADGTVSFDDETEYTQEGDSFGASDLNAMAHAINNTSSDAEHTSYDNTTSGLVSDNVQGAIDEINDNLTDGIGGTSDKFRFGTDGNGNYGYIKKVEGADTFFPFKSNLTDINPNQIIDDKYKISFYGSCTIPIQGYARLSVCNWRGQSSENHIQIRFIYADGTYGSYYTDIVTWINYVDVPRNAVQIEISKYSGGMTESRCYYSLIN